MSELKEITVNPKDYTDEQKKATKDFAGFASSLMWPMFIAGMLFGIACGENLSGNSHPTLLAAVSLFAIFMARAIVGLKQYRAQERVAITKIVDEEK